MQNVQINSDSKKSNSNNNNDENVSKNKLNNNINNTDGNSECDANCETCVQLLKDSIEETARSELKEENENALNPSKYVPVRYSYSGGYFDKQFAEIEVQMNLVEVKNSLAKTCEILKEINFLESLRKGSKLSEAKLECSKEYNVDDVPEISQSEHSS